MCPKEISECIYWVINLGFPNLMFWRTENGVTIALPGLSILLFVYVSKRVPVSHLLVLNRATFVILLCDLTFQLDTRLCLRWSIIAITMYPVGEQLRAQHSECFYLHLTC